MKRITTLVKGLSLFALVSILGLSTVWAQETSGSVEGSITTADGDALPGVIVSITGTGYPSGTAVSTNEKGRFRFPAVPPGTYEIKAEMDGFASNKVPSFRVNLGAALSIRMEMQLQEVSEQILVTATAPIISVTASDTSVTLSDEWIEKMPLGRDFSSIVDQAAGANNEQDSGGISIDGSSGAENRFVVDGVDTTNLQTGVSQKRVVTDFLQEVQVKQGGYMAEFGGSTGGVISAVTKQGGSEFSGSVHAYWDEDNTVSGNDSGGLGPLYGSGEQTLRINPLTGDAEYITYDEDDVTRFEPGFTLGGPLVKDRLWFFAGYSPTTSKADRTINFLSGSTGTYSREANDEFITANVSGTFSNFFYRLGFNIDDFERDNVLPSLAGTGSSDPADFSTDRVQPSESYTLNVDFLPTNNLSTNLRGGRFEYDTRDDGFSTGLWWGPSTGSAGTACQQFPDQCDPSQNPPLGSVTPNNQGTLYDFFERDYLQLDSTLFVEDFVGDHEFKLGVLREEIGNDVLDGYSNTRILFYIDQSVTDLNRDLIRGEFGHYRVLQIATQGEVSSENTALFLQDSWRVSDRLTVNVGVRAEQEKIPSYASSSSIPDTAIQFDLDEKVAPRLGVAYDVLGDGRWKAYSSYGIFYDMTKLEMPRGSFGGDSWIDNWYSLDTLDFNSIVSSCHIVENSVDSIPVGCPGEFLFLADRRHPSNDPESNTIDPDLKPMESNEITFGLEHLLGDNMMIGLRYVHKELKRTIEDVGVVVPGVGEVFYIANPGEGIGQNVLGADFPDQPKPVREYDGLTLNFRKNYSNNWGLSAAYTYSRLYGNYSGLASSDEDGRVSPNVNRFFDSLNGNFDANGNAVYGRLGTDRPHQFKAQFIYGFDWGTSVGLNQRIASGTPVSTEYTVSPQLPFFPYGRGDLGRTPTFTQTDLLVSHEIAFGDRYGVELSLNVTNLFDENVQISTYINGLNEDLPLSEEEFFAGFDPEQVIADENVSRDPRFGFADDFQNPRQFRIGAKFKF